MKDFFHKWQFLRHFGLFWVGHTVSPPQQSYAKIGSQQPVSGCWILCKPGSQLQCTDGDSCYLFSFRDPQMIYFPPRIFFCHLYGETYYVSRSFVFRENFLPTLGVEIWDIFRSLCSFILVSPRNKATFNGWQIAKHLIGGRMSKH